jgi:hypothetical protein
VRPRISTAASDDWHGMVAAQLMARGSTQTGPTQLWEVRAGRRARCPRSAKIGNGNEPAMPLASALAARIALGDAVTP